MTANGNTLQKSVVEAIKVIAGTRIDSLKLDKTITGIIKKSVGNNTYIVNYEGGEIRAVAEDGAAYMTNSSVYVLIPEGDWSKKKTILGYTSSTKANNNIEFVSTAMSGYNISSDNLLKINSSNLEHSFGVDSLQATPLGSEYQDVNILYQIPSDTWLGLPANADLANLENKDTSQVN